MCILMNWRGRRLRKRDWPDLQSAVEMQRSGRSTSFWVTGSCSRLGQNGELQMGDACQVFWYDRGKIFRLFAFLAVWRYRSLVTGCAARCYVLCWVWSWKHVGRKNFWSATVRFRVS